MKTIGAVVVGVALVAAILFVSCLLATVFGAAVGWVVGAVFGNTILDFLSRLGMDVNGLEMWKVGAALGFIGSFFRSSQSVKKDG